MSKETFSISSRSTSANPQNAMRRTGNSVIERASFREISSGNWELDTPYGGASILDETDTSSEYFGTKSYGVSLWDSDYNIIENGQARDAQRFENLNAAKRYAKDRLRDELGRR